VNSASSVGLQVLEPRYDKLGNLLHDDQNNYIWDADIHLLNVTTKSGQPGTRKEESRTIFHYDPLHRRVARQESLTNTITLFIHDRWNVITEYETTFAASRPQLTARRTWGEDRSGSLQGAGGIGGLLASVQHPPTTATNGEPQPTASMCFHYDSNGNVIALSDAKGKESARYKYDAFGKTILVQGPMATFNLYQFSTKPVEKTSGLAFFGFRYYSPKFGRWHCKDPIREFGGINMYCMLENKTTFTIDYLGLADKCCVESITHKWDGEVTPRSEPDGTGGTDYHFQHNIHVEVKFKQGQQGCGGDNCDPKRCTVKQYVKEKGETDFRYDDANGGGYTFANTEGVLEKKDLFPDTPGEILTVVQAATLENRLAATPIDYKEEFRIIVTDSDGTEVARKEGQWVSGATPAGAKKSSDVTLDKGGFN